MSSKLIQQYKYRSRRYTLRRNKKLKDIIKRNTVNNNVQQNKTKQMNDFIQQHPHLCSTDRAKQFIEKGTQYIGGVDEQYVRQMFAQATQTCKFYKGQLDDMYTCSLCNETKLYNKMGSSARLYHTVDHHLIFDYTGLSSARHGGRFDEGIDSIINLFEPDTHVCKDCIAAYPYKVLDKMEQLGYVMDNSKHQIHIPNQ